MIFDLQRFATGELLVRKNKINYCCSLADSGVAKPKLTIRKNDVDYSVALSDSAEKPRLCVNVNGSTKYVKMLPKSLVVWLPFDSSVTEDKFDNEWTTVGNPVIQDDENAISGKSLYLDGSSYLQLDGGITLGGQGFTIDGWINMDSSTPASGRIVMVRALSATSCIITTQRERDGTGKIRAWSCNEGDYSKDEGAYSLTTHEWTDQRIHFAVVYSSSANTVTFFINGIQEVKFTDRPQYNRSKFKIEIGFSESSNSNYLKGTLEHFRIFDGIALWTENFTPPTEMDYYGVAWLTFNNSVTEDKCGGTWTTTGTPTLSTSIKKFDESALCVNNSNYITLNDFVIGGKDFTIDYWAYATGTSTFFSMKNGSSLFQYFYGSSGYFETWYKNDMSTYVSNITFSKNEWHHVAIVYQHEEKTVKTFVDGNLAATFTNKTIARGDYSPVYLGKTIREGGSTCYIDEFRIWDGIAKWTENLTPAMDYNGLVVYLPFNDSPTFDMCGNIWTAAGNPVIQDDENAISGKSLYLDGSSVLCLGKLEIGGQDFTVDYWANISTTTANGRTTFFFDIAATGYNMLIGYRGGTSAPDKIVLKSGNTADTSKEDLIESISTITSVGVRVHVAVVYFITPKKR